MVSRISAINSISCPNKWNFCPCFIPTVGSEFYPEDVFLVSFELEKQLMQDNLRSGCNPILTHASTPRLFLAPRKTYQNFLMSKSLKDRTYLFQEILLDLHPRKLTWIPKIAMFERSYIKNIIIGIYLRFRGGYKSLKIPKKQSGVFFVLGAKAQFSTELEACFTNPNHPNKQQGSSHFEKIKQTQANLLHFLKEISIQKNSAC